MGCVRGLRRQTSSAMSSGLGYSFTGTVLGGPRARAGPRWSGGLPSWLGGFGAAGGARPPSRARGERSEGAVRDDLELYGDATAGRQLCDLDGGARRRHAERAEGRGVPGKGV